MKKLLTCILILTAAMSIGAGLTACNVRPPENNNPPIVKPNPDDENKDPEKPPVVDTKEFDKAVKNANDFVAKMKTSQNFTISHKLASVTKIIKYDENKTEIQENNTTIYFAYDENDQLYKIAQNAENKWTQTEESSHPAPISTLLSTLEGVEWKSYEDEQLTGTTKYNNKTANLSVKLASGTCEYSLSYSGIKTTGSIYNVETTTVTLPEIEDEKQPEEPTIDYDNLTEEQIRALTPIMVKNIKTKLESNIKQNIWNNSVINNVFAIDFNENNLILGLEFTNESLGHQYGVFKYELTDKITLKKLVENDFTPATKKMGTPIIQFEYTNNNEKTDAVFNKLYQDKIIENNSEYDLQDLQDRGTGQVGYNRVYLYKINKNQICNIVLQIRSDGNTKDYITDNMINGTLNAERGYKITDIISYEFTDNALYDFAGLEKQNNSEQEN